LRLPSRPRSRLRRQQAHRRVTASQPATSRVVTPGACRTASRGRHRPSVTHLPMPQPAKGFMIPGISQSP
jgi:hypothetical protein